MVVLAVIDREQAVVLVAVEWVVQEVAVLADLDQEGEVVLAVLVALLVPT